MCLTIDKGFRKERRIYYDQTINKWLTELQSIRKIRPFPDAVAWPIGTSYRATS